jgi:hypothetical protein
MEFSERSEKTTEYSRRPSGSISSRNAGMKTSAKMRFMIVAPLGAANPTCECRAEKSIVEIGAPQRMQTCLTAGPRAALL